MAVAGTQGTSNNAKHVLDGFDDELTGGSFNIPRDMHGTQVLRLGKPEHHLFHVLCRRSFDIGLVPAHYTPIDHHEPSSPDLAACRFYGAAHI